MEPQLKNYLKKKNPIKVVNKFYHPFKYKKYNGF